MLKKIISLFLSLVLFTTVAFAADEVWLPDPGPALGVEAEYSDTGSGNDGIQYAHYIYELESDMDIMSHFIVVYTEALQNMGFTAQKVKVDGTTVVYCMQYTRNGFTAEMALLVAPGSGEVTKYTPIEWTVILSVPEGMVFEIGKGAPGIVDGNTVCAGCGGSGKCMGCSGNRRVNYGNGKETCVVCDGNGICNVCDGAGSY